MSETANLIAKRQPNTFFGVVTNVQSYVNILYHLLAFPLGLFYFVFLVTGISVGVGLIVIWVGIPILLLVMAAWWGMAAFERVLTGKMLGVAIAPMSREGASRTGVWARLKAHLRNPITWKGLVYLLLKFPYGILAFVLVVSALSLSVSLLAAPLVYPFANYDLGYWEIDTPEKALMLSVVGVGLGIVALHVLNGLAALWARFAQIMLGGSGQVGQDNPEPELIRAVWMPSRQVQNVLGIGLVGLGVLLVAREIGLTVFSVNLGNVLVPILLIALGLWFAIGRMVVRDEPDELSTRDE